MRKQKDVNGIAAHSLFHSPSLKQSHGSKWSGKLKPGEEEEEVIYQRKKLFYVSSCERDLEGVPVLFWSRGLPF